MFLIRTPESQELFAGLGRDLWFLYKYLGKGTKNTREGMRNPWMKVKTMDGEEVGFRENYVEWLCETGESTPVPIETFATHEGAYV